MEAAGSDDAATAPETNAERRPPRAARGKHLDWAWFSIHAEADRCECPSSSSGPEPLPELKSLAILQLSIGVNPDQVVISQGCSSPRSSDTVTGQRSCSPWPTATVAAKSSPTSLTWPSRSRNSPRTGPSTPPCSALYLVQVVQRLLRLWPLLRPSVDSPSSAASPRCCSLLHLSIAGRSSAASRRYNLPHIVLKNNMYLYLLSDEVQFELTEACRLSSAQPPLLALSAACRRASRPAPSSRRSPCALHGRRSSYAELPLFDRASSPDSSLPPPGGIIVVVVDAFSVSSYNACLIPITSFDIRSDDEDEEYAGYCSDRHGQHGQHNEQYYGPDEFDELDRSCNSATSQTVEENIISKEIAARVIDQGFPSTLPVMKTEDDPEPDNSSECGAASSIYALEGTDINQVDFEKNELFWLPPEPEDEEDEMEGGLFFEDDDDELVTDGEQCRIRSPSSFGSGEFRSKDRSSEQHKKVMKNVVDGHFRALISQLLQVENISLNEGDNMGWLEIVTSLSWEAANFLRPDTSQSGGMDPGGYVKVKCLACGHRSESTVVKGIVCKKNVAHRRMTSRIEKPRLLLLAGALEYHRVTNQLSSIDTLLQQVHSPFYVLVCE
ncbi:hypothetical protein PR202_gn00310 [Eleusine coracana subsp. coracana]|uniref:Uncharacterized protein n=1 Tax=Eleusine coracana subsp. coracana TaxID=191504 RepID=A0AAV5G1F5_ELECO|nr:hypothetical protein PR202_gn00205 [Eleusine coracana subsp. coracana]GJN40992.1 hypothetical protein PR202_gn00310 [Eleusine coracana subsp. coracana]